MRLIDAESLSLREFPDDRIPKYAILSHTWGGSEISYRELFSSSDAVKQKDGYRKIQYACRQAQHDKIRYIWADTCCIDKASSAELSEAINSMFRWYKNAKVCYAFMADVELEDAKSDKGWMAPFAASRWFTRGWTLQELLAPSEVQFFSKDWLFIGAKLDLCDFLAEITGIGAHYLSGRDVSDASVARRMSWAAKRSTTRVEDEAYSLLGLFGVNMPLLYGEGANAFRRLQEEIIKISEDQTIFAWGAWKGPGAGEAEERVNELRGPFARSAREFAQAGHLVPNSVWQCRDPYSLTNKGLQITLNVLKDSELHGFRDIGDGIVALLGCHDEHRPLAILALVLAPMPSIIDPKFEITEFVRVGSSFPVEVLLVRRDGKKLEAEHKTVFIKQGPVKQKTLYKGFSGFILPNVPSNNVNLGVTEIYPFEHWSPATGTILDPDGGWKELNAVVTMGYAQERVAVDLKPLAHPVGSKRAQVTLFLSYDRVEKTHTSAICMRPTDWSTKELFDWWVEKKVAPFVRQVFLDKEPLSVALIETSGAGLEGIFPIITRHHDMRIESYADGLQLERAGTFSILARRRTEERGGTS